MLMMQLSHNFSNLRFTGTCNHTALLKLQKDDRLRLSVSMFATVSVTWSLSGGSSHISILNLGSKTRKQRDFNGFHPLLVHVGGTQQNCKKTRATRANTGIKICQFGPSTIRFSEKWSQISEAALTLSFFRHHQAAISRLPVQTEWAPVGSLFRAASLSTRAGADFMWFHCGSPSWLFLSVSHYGLISELWKPDFSSVVRREKPRERQRDRTGYERILSCPFW